MSGIDRRKAIASDLAACKKAFTDANIPWVIADGIVLGYARYNDIMPWDTDLDMAVFVELDGPSWKRLSTSLNKHGFRVPSVQKDFMYCYREVEFNMWLYHKNGNYYESFPKSTPGLKFVEKAKWYDEPQIIDFLGSEYPMPNYMDDYLVCRYGLDWLNNIVKDHDEHFKDKRGGTDQSLWTKGKMSKHGNLWPKIIKISDNSEEVLG